MKKIFNNVALTLGAGASYVTIKAHLTKENRTDGENQALNAALNKIQQKSNQRLMISEGEYKANLEYNNFINEVVRDHQNGTLDPDRAALMVELAKKGNSKNITEHPDLITKIRDQNNPQDPVANSPWEGLDIQDILSHTDNLEFLNYVGLSVILNTLFLIVILTILIFNNFINNKITK